MARICLDHVSLTFKVRQQGRITFKEFLVRQMYHRKRNPVLEVRALQDVNLLIQEGDRLGIMLPTPCLLLSGREPSGFSGV